MPGPGVQSEAARGPAASALGGQPNQPLAAVMGSLRPRGREGLTQAPGKLSLMCLETGAWEHTAGWSLLGLSFCVRQAGALTIAAVHRQLKEAWHSAL